MRHEPLEETYQKRKVRISTEPTRFIYRYPDQCVRMDLQTQRKVLRLLRGGMSPEDVSRQCGVKTQSVRILGDRGVAFCEADDSHPRCNECGAKLVAKPCLACELARVTR